MGAGTCSCCETHPGKGLELNMTSPKNKLSLLGFNSFFSPKGQPSDAELQVRIRLLQTVNSSKTIKLKAINSGSLAKGTTFTIFPSGMENSPREIKDGYTHFGTVLKSETQYINDIAIPIRDSEPQLSSPSRNFTIYYHIEKDTFYLKDLGKGYGPFIKILHSTVIKNNWMINIGETFLVFNIETLHLSPPRLTVKKFSGSDNGNIKYFIFRSFEAAEFVNDYILVGRKKTCDVFIEDFLLSKIQCSIFYDLVSGWTIHDGDFRSQKESMNGTWLYLAEEFEIFNGMVFKYNQTLMQVRNYLGDIDELICINLAFYLFKIKLSIY